MSNMNIAVMGSAWITASGISCMSDSKDFSMPEGTLPELRRELLTTSPDQRWGRLDNYSKAGLITASLALKDAGIDTVDIHKTTAIVVSTVTGCADVDNKYFHTVLPQEGLLASPNLFAYTLPNCMLGEVSIRYGFNGPAMVLSQTKSDMMNGIVGGIKLLHYGLCERVVAGYCNIEAGMDSVDTECKPGAVFLVMQKTKNNSLLVYNNSELLYNGSEISNLVDLMRGLIHNRFTELQ
jgi:3-oxoacyl-[acyl-carrier-protein] synthase II